MPPLSHWTDRPLGQHPLRGWAESTGSLTRRVRRVSPGFNVLLLGQAAQLPLPDERALVRLPSQGPALVREVLLRDGDVALVYAHSVTTLSALNGWWRLLKGLGNRPLGEALFTDPLVQRQPMQFGRLPRHHPLVRRLGSQWMGGGELPVHLLARRSVFLRRGTPLLVTEVFLPALSGRMS